MDGRKTCKGCGTVVVKPIICSICIASHPACLPRTRHPHSGGLLTNCKSSPRSDSNIDLNCDLLENIQKLIRSEFENLRKEILNLYQADLVKISEYTQSLSNRITKLEVDLASGASAASLSHPEEDIIEEMADRNRRSNNLILYNLDEVDDSSSNKSHKVDLSFAKDILQVIIPDRMLILRVTRLGGRKTGYARPLRVTLPSREDAISILRNNNCYVGLIKIHQDQTIKQRKFLNDLRGRLKEYHEAGNVGKTIRFFDGVPKIVDHPVSLSSPHSKKN